MEEKIKESKKEDIFDELRRLTESSFFSHKILKNFNIFSILIGIISFFVFTLLLGLVALILGGFFERKNVQ